MDRAHTGRERGRVNDARDRGSNPWPNADGRWDRTRNSNLVGLEEAMTQGERDELKLNTEDKIADGFYSMADISGKDLLDLLAENHRMRELLEGAQRCMSRDGIYPFTLSQIEDFLAEPS
jgi:hypothetical protein